LQAEFHNLIFTIISILSLIGLLSYYIIFSRVKISSFDIENSFFDKPVSIVICAKNELENLKKHSASWLNQSYANFEIVIVNDESTDGSFEFLTLLASEYNNLKVIHIDRSAEENEDLRQLMGKRYALRKGILATKNDYLLFTDADCFSVSINWITQMTMAFTNDDIEIVLGYSPYVKKHSLLNKFIQLETLLTAFHYFGFANLGIPYMGVGRNVAYKKTVFNDDVFIKSNQSIGGDDDLIVQQFATKLNTAYITSTNARMMSIPAFTLKKYIKQKKRHLGAGLSYSNQIKFVLNLFPIFLILFLVSIGFLALHNLLLACVLLGLHVLVIFTLIYKSVLLKDENY
jgi:glycosyltransferase involved in cell wall biosynthesis